MQICMVLFVEGFVSIVTHVQEFLYAALAACSVVIQPAHCDCMDMFIMICI